MPTGITVVINQGIFIATKTIRLLYAGVFIFTYMKPFFLPNPALLLSNRLILCLFAFALLFSSCEFQPSEIPLTEVQKPSDFAPMLEIEVTPDMDTLKLASDVWASFRFRSQVTQVNRVMIYLDDTQILDSQYDPLSLPKVYINPDLYSEGLHLITIRAITPTMTGSIADKVGAEGYLYEVQWPVIIKHNVSSMISILSATYKNPGVELRWEKYDYYGFEFYHINKSTASTGNSFSTTISDPNRTVFLDTTYLEGEYVSYSVSLNYSFSHNTYFDRPIPSPEVSSSPGESLLVKWQKPANLPYLGKYYLQMKAPQGGTGGDFESSNPETTTTTFPPVGFGGMYELQLRYVPKTYTGPYLNYESSGGRAYYSLGNRMTGFEYGHAIPSSSELLLYKNGTFYKYHVKTHTITDSLSTGQITGASLIRMTESGQYFSYFQNNRFVFRKTSDFSLAGQFAADFMENGDVRLRSVSISDAKRAVVVDHFNSLRLFDVVSGDELVNVPSGSEIFMQSAAINSAGNKVMYLITYYNSSQTYIKMASVNGNSLQPVGEVLTSGFYSTGSSFVFHGETAVLLKYVSAYTYEVETRNVADFSKIAGTQIPGNFKPVALDPASGTLVTRYEFFPVKNYTWFVDYNNNQIKKMMPLVGRGELVLYDGILFSGSGSWLPIDALVTE